MTDIADINHPALDPLAEKRKKRARTAAWRKCSWPLKKTAGSK
jgi:hypothetical protein